MILIQNKANSVVIGNEEFPKNTLSFRRKDETGYVQIRAINNHTLIDQIFSDYVNAAHQPYTTIDNLCTDLSTFLYK